MRALAALTLTLVACGRGGGKADPRHDAAAASQPAQLDAAPRPPSGPPIVWRSIDPAISPEGALALPDGRVAVFGHLTQTSTIAGTRIEGPADRDEVSLVVIHAVDGTPTAAFPLRLRQSKIFGAVVAGDELQIGITGIGPVEIAGVELRPQTASWVYGIVTIDPATGPRTAFALDDDAWPQTILFNADALVRMPDGDLVVLGQLDDDDPVTRYSAAGKRRWRHTVPGHMAATAHGDTLLLAMFDDDWTGIGELDARGKVKRRCAFSALDGSVWAIAAVGDEVVALGSAKFRDGVDHEHDLPYALPCVAPERPRRELLPGLGHQFAGAGIGAGHLIAVYGQHAVVDPTADQPRVIPLDEQIDAWHAVVTPDGDVVLVGYCGEDRAPCVERVDLGL